MQTTTIWMDLDGTIADLYGVEGWLNDLINHNPRPYREAKVLVNMSILARLLNRLQRGGYKIGVISWCAKNSTADYDSQVINEKEKWLKRHLPSVNFDKIHIVEFGTPKSNFADTNDILFDDEIKNRVEWCGKAFSQYEIISILKYLTSTL